MVLWFKVVVDGLGKKVFFNSYFIKNLTGFSNFFILQYELHYYFYFILSLEIIRSNFKNHTLEFRILAKHFKFSKKLFFGLVIKVYSSSFEKCLKAFLIG
jgi:hypothetical protein